MPARRRRPASDPAAPAHPRWSRGRAGAAPRRLAAQADSGATAASGVRPRHRGRSGHRRTSAGRGRRAGDAPAPRRRRGGRGRGRGAGGTVPAAEVAADCQRREQSPPSASVTSLRECHRTGDRDGTLIPAPCLGGTCHSGRQERRQRGDDSVHAGDCAASICSTVHPAARSRLCRCSSRLGRPGSRCSTVVLELHPRLGITPGRPGRVDSPRASRILVLRRPGAEGPPAPADRSSVSADDYALVSARPSTVRACRFPRSRPGLAHSGIADAAVPQPCSSCPRVHGSLRRWSPAQVERCPSPATSRGPTHTDPLTASNVSRAHAGRPVVPQVPLATMLLDHHASAAASTPWT